jgi:hypothetical protein
MLVTNIPPQPSAHQPSAGENSLDKIAETLEAFMARILSSLSVSNDILLQYIRVAESSQHGKEMVRSAIRESNLLAYDVGMDIAEGMRDAALARFTSMIVAGSLGVMMSAYGGFKLYDLSKILGNNGGTGVPPQGGDPHQGGVPPQGGDPHQGGVPPQGDVVVNGPPKDIMQMQNDVYKAQTQTQLVSMVFTQLCTQITDSIKASGEYAGSIYDAEVQIWRTTREYILSHAEELSELYNIEKDIFVKALDAAMELKFPSLSPN